MIALLLALTMALPATFNGATWQDASPCDDLAGDLIYSVCAVVLVPVGTALSPTGRTAYAAASTSSSTAYVALGMPDNLLFPEFTHRSGSIFYRARGSASLADGQLHTLKGVADGTTLSLYMDGARVGGAPLDGAAPSSRGLCTIGALRRTSGTSSYWIGEVRELRTLDRAMTPAEIDSAGCGTVPPPVVEPCHGHTGLRWDPYPGLAAYFEVERAEAGSAWMLVGDTREKNRPENDESPATRAETWDLLRAWSIPLAGAVYSYRVRAVSGTGALSEPSNVVNCGPQDPTLCYPEDCR